MPTMRIPGVDVPIGSLRVRIVFQSHRDGHLPTLYMVERRGKTLKGRLYWARVAGFPTKKLAARHVAKIMAARLIAERSARRPTAQPAALAAHGGGA